MTARPSPLTAEEVIADGGWHPRYARVIALASDDGYGFALVDGNGDGSELEAEAWTRRDGTWGCGFYLRLAHEESPGCAPRTAVPRSSLDEAGKSPELICPQFARATLATCSGAR
jgi:hypothetical protein